MNLTRRLLLVLPLFYLLASCGGGSSSGPSGPPPIEVQAGVYSGTLTLNFNRDGELLDTSTIPFEITVAGSGVTQQVIIAFREFSGSSSVGPNQEFRIPSGRFPFQIGVEGVSCTMALVFDGRFVGQTVAGTVEGMLNCNPNNIVFDMTGSFEASLSQGKALLDSNSSNDIVLKNLSSLL